MTGTAAPCPALGQLQAFNLGQHWRAVLAAVPTATNSPEVKGLLSISELNAIEQAIRSNSLDEPCRIWQLHAAPKLAALWQWLQETLSVVSLMLALAKTILYSPS
ncbi:hypothetical protein LRP30_32220 [Bradyrhizobium sp. C-145]|uniref:hypothetical protein n=1 Tax=Bradyrhizobium sp. C-145 TaxID=574727 RepID=UPI00201B5B6C|nr:hypothetical protein [Bradyrhizobium sp. C-145]UQR68259.1 hypothetical protein LRP30_32220 [Bradyrhizobium sp. C-145]